MSSTTREHAVVLGAGVAGLLAARVLADAYEQVTVVERDRLPAGPGAEHAGGPSPEPPGSPGVLPGWSQRRGVPQGPHVPGLLPAGLAVMEELMPGLTAELTAA